LWSPSVRIHAPSLARRCGGNLNASVQTDPRPGQADLARVTSPDHLLCHSQRAVVERNATCATASSPASLDTPGGRSTQHSSWRADHRVAAEERPIKGWDAAAHKSTLRTARWRTQWIHIVYGTSTALLDAQVTNLPQLPDKDPPARPKPVLDQDSGQATCSSLNPRPRSVTRYTGAPASTSIFSLMRRTSRLMA
jgi:hypothetical protein